MKMYSALVKDGERLPKADFIHNLRSNGNKVNPKKTNPKKVKESYYTIILLVAQIRTIVIKLSIDRYKNM